MSTTRTITAVERAPFASSKVNREAGYIDGVLICGLTSRNGRDYPLAVLARDYAKYEGVAVNTDHADESTIGRRIGWLTDVKPGADGQPRGRLNLLSSHKDTAAVFEAAEKNPSLFGMSHVAVCGTKRVNGRETVESINKVLSVDLVADPATTKSLYESYQPQVPPMRFKAFAESVAAKWPTHRPALVKFLREEMGELEMDAPPPMDAATDPSDPVKAAFSQAMHALVDQLDAGEIDGAAMVSKLKTLMKAAEKMAGGGAEPETETPAEDLPAEFESLKKQLAGAIKEAADLKLSALIGDTKLSDVQRKAVGLLTEEADRKALVESFKTSAKSDPPRSPGRTTPADAKTTKESAVPTDGKAFAEYVR